jgi:5-methyltetrahydrofolate--homocysteine methyltransferase
MDGAMGTELRSRGLSPAECGELWNLTRPELVRQVHAAYAAAGARCFLANTFQANPVALDRHGEASRLEEICRASVALARSVAGSEAFVIGDVGPILTAEGTEFDDLADLRRTVQGLIGADAILLETCSSPEALAAAAKMASWPETRHLPVMLSLTYRRHSNDRLTTFSGHGPEWFARQASQNRVAVLGVNCGRDVGLAEMASILSRYRQETDLPLLARPNAGSPTRIDGRWVHPLSSREMAERLPDLVAAGATLIGGCCGTTPEHIAACRDVLAGTGRDA